MIQIHDLFCNFVQYFVKLIICLSWYISSMQGLSLGLVKTDGQYLNGNFASRGTNSNVVFVILTW